MRTISRALLFAAPALVAGIEFAVPALLLLSPRYGVLLALIFHQTINFMPSTYARSRTGANPWRSAPATAATRTHVLLPPRAPCRHARAR